MMNKRKFYVADHKWMFLFGFVFYLLVPCLVGVTGMFKGYPGIDLYQQYFNKIPPGKINAYLLICGAWFFAFYLGHFFYKLIRPVKHELGLFTETYADFGIQYVGMFLVLLMVLFTWLARNSVFGGYATYDIAARGKLSTLLVIFNFFLLYQLLGGQKVSPYIIGGTAITCLLLLSMGGRMYVFQTLIIIIVYKTSFAKKRWSSWKMAAVMLTGFFAGSAAGVWRLGSAFTLQKAAYSFFAEPVFTWISTSTFLTMNELPLVNIPVNFLTSFLNLVPNTFVNFRQYVVSAQGMGYQYLSPLGADSIWSTYVINFGIIGSVIFIFLTGFLLNFLRELSTKNKFWAVYYILVCGMLPFQFFRDGFYIINKQLFFNFLLFPAAILYVLKLVKYLNVRHNSTQLQRANFTA